MAQELRATLDDGLWIVEDRASKRWWTTTGADDDALITADNGRIVKAGSAMGTKIRATVSLAVERAA